MFSGVQLYCILFSSPPDQYTRMFTLSLILEWPGQEGPGKEGSSDMLHVQSVNVQMVYSKTCLKRPPV